jgi:hypothetical protein
VLQLRRVEQGADHALHDADLRPDAEGQEHREEEEAPARETEAGSRNKTLLQNLSRAETLYAPYANELAYEGRTLNVPEQNFL